MNLLEKIKINLDYILGKSDLSLYAPFYAGQNISSEEWQKRWKFFSENDESGFVWYGVDAGGNLAEFSCCEAYVPEVFFQDLSVKQRIRNFFETLPEITASRLPENLRPELKQSDGKLSETDVFWQNGANKGLFIFEEVEEEFFEQIFYKPNYELLLIPEKSLKISNLPTDIQQLLKPFRFENLKFADCRFLDVSKYLYCEF